MRYTREDGCRAWLTYAYWQPQNLMDALSDFGDAGSIYDRLMKDGGAFLKPYLTAVQIQELKERAQPDAMHDMMLTMQKYQIGVVSMEDYGYPDSLRNIADPPPILFYRGDLDCLMGKCVTIVGSRAASANAIDAAQKVARELAEHGVTIVSGLAAGIDTAAHEGCLKGGSPTAGIMACGLDVDYPASSRRLKEEIIRKGGVLLSELPLGAPAIGRNFPVRNRIMSGLSKGVVLIEARIKSGSMTTVQHALDQGREVFAYPGNIGSEWAEGTHQLLREGANYFTSAQDVLEDLGWMEDRPVPTKEEKQELPAMTEEQRRVYAQLSQGECSFDQLASATGLDTPALSGVLTMLQILGLVKSMPGKTYIRV